MPCHATDAPSAAIESTSSCASTCGFAPRSSASIEISVSRSRSYCVLYPATSASAWNAPAARYASGLMPFVCACG